jgi:lysophospholipase L1-like esterase
MIMIDHLRWRAMTFKVRGDVRLTGTAMALLFCANLLTPIRAQVVPGGPAPTISPSPLSFNPFEQEVTALERRRIDITQRPVVFYGSSSIRLWTSLNQDFAGYPVVNCGFGGSRLSDCVRYVSRLVLRLKPAVVVLYAGDNDLAEGTAPEKAFASFRELYRALRDYSEQMPIAYISVKPCPARIRNLSNILRFNDMVKTFLQNDPATRYIDICTAMLGPDRKPNPALFVQDQIHLSGAGYQILRRDVSAFLASELRPATATSSTATAAKAQPSPPTSVKGRSPSHTSS